MTFRQCFLALALAMAARAERINHEGRLLGPVPVVPQPILFNTPEADAVVAALQIMPATSAWNERVEQRPVLANSNAMLRPAGWTSGDAAGLAMFPALVRYDECQRGMVEHALRLIVKRTRQGPIYPATHQASVPPTSDPNVPAMGQRLRLKASFTIPASWTIQEKAVALALKKYGAIVADNGNFFSVSVCPDDRFPAGCFDHLRMIAIGNFEVVQTTGANEGPRSPGAPVADAGSEQVISFGTSATLAGAVTGSGTAQWKVAAGPGTATFANPTQPATTATFSHPGRYTLLLSTDDGIHAVAYDAVVIEVRLAVALAEDGNDLLIDFPSLTGRTYRLERSPDLSTASWSTFADNLPGTGAILQAHDTDALSQSRRFYRVKVLP